MIATDERDKIWSMLEMFSKAQRMVGYMQHQCETGVITVQKYTKALSHLVSMKEGIDAELNKMTTTPSADEHVTVLITNSPMTNTTVSMLKKILNGTTYHEFMDLAGAKAKNFTVEYDDDEGGDRP